MNKKVTNITTLTFNSSEELIRFMKEGSPLPPGKIFINYKTKIVDDKSDPGRHDMRDPWPKKAIVEKVTITVDHDN